MQSELMRIELNKLISGSSHRGSSDDEKQKYDYERIASLISSVSPDALDHSFWLAITHERLDVMKLIVARGYKKYSNHLSSASALGNSGILLYLVSLVVMDEKLWISVIEGASYNGMLELVKTLFSTYPHLCLSPSDHSRYHQSTTLDFISIAMKYAATSGHLDIFVT